MKEKDSKAIIILVIVLIASILNVGYTLNHIASYNAQKESGNAKWKEVEERIIRIEEEVYGRERK